MLGFAIVPPVIEKAQAYVTGPDLGQRLFGGLLGVGRAVLNATFSAFCLPIMTLYFPAALPSTKRPAINWCRRRGQQFENATDPAGDDLALHVEVDRLKVPLRDLQRVRLQVDGEGGSSAGVRTRRLNQQWSETRAPPR
jgi:hypothetical protein